MEYKSKTENNIKAKDRMQKLYGVSKGLTEKDMKSFSYIVEKTSRIASVTFLLADVLEGDSELRKELQRTAIRLVKDAAESVHVAHKRSALTSGLVALTALLDTASRSGQLSQMNTEILSDEITALSELMGVIDWGAGRRYFDSTLFEGEVPRDILATEPVISRSNIYQRQEKDVYQQRHSYTVPTQDFYETKNIKDSEQVEQKASPQYKDRVQEVQKDRRATILSLVQKKDRITVKDVTTVVKDCSEKTIQRELLALVKQGVLKKEGERRWSTYSLV